MDREPAGGRHVGNPGARARRPGAGCERHGEYECLRRGPDRDGEADSLGAGEFPLQTATQEGSVTGQFKVPTGARSGTFPITVICESGTEVRQTLTVSGRGGTELGGVKAGDGGSLATLSVAQLALGGVLITGALIAAGHYARRRAQEA